MVNCRFCKSDVEVKIDDSFKYFNCPHCGNYIIPDSSAYSLGPIAEKNYNIDKLKIYLFFHNNKDIWQFIGSREAYIAYLKENSNKKVNCVDIDTVEDWYPKTFSDKIDNILLKIHNLSKFDGDIIYLNSIDEASLYMCNSKNEEWYFVSRFLCENDYISSVSSGLQLQLNGLTRVDSLQKSTNESNQVFIAMSFDKNLDKANLAIQNAIRNNHYDPLRMDEYKHNKQIVPEMLFQIKKSKFVIVDLTYHNNGAYYEAGYAQALGKQVILTCKKESFEDDSHFDVKQQATIIWQDEDDLEKRLTTWIEATIL